MRTAALRRPAARKSRRGSAPGQVKTYAAPTGGWVTNQNLAAQEEGTARVMQNGFPTLTGVRFRGGSKKVATVGEDAVTALFEYNSPGADAFFAATATDIYEISAFNSSTAPSADVSSLTGGAWVAQQIATAGGEYLVCVNGADAPRTYNGSWATASLSGSSLTVSNLSFVWLYRNRLWFVESGTLNLWYLGVDSIGGTLTKLSLGGVVNRGGEIMLGATWSLDAGDGMDDKMVVVTDLGEIVVYEGDDPAADNWALIGRYDIAPPLGPKATMRAGGDLLIATVDGLIPVSQAINTDREALALVAVSRPIEPDWRFEAQQWSENTPWEVIRFPRENMLIVSLPHTDGDRMFVANLHTGRWAEYTGWNAQCLGLYQNLAYFGDDAGNIFRAESGGTDNGDAYTVKIQPAMDHLGSPAAHKEAKMLRATLRSYFDVPTKLSVSANYEEDFPAAPNAYTGTVTTAALWGTGVWGTSLWGDGGDSGGSDRRTVSTRWRSTRKNGFALAPQLQFTNGSSWRPDTELVAFDLLYETGDIVV